MGGARVIKINMMFGRGTLTIGAGKIKGSCDPFIVVRSLNKNLVVGEPATEEDIGDTSIHFLLRDMRAIEAFRTALDDAEKIILGGTLPENKTI